MSGRKNFIYYSLMGIMVGFLVVHLFIFDKINIPSESMIPTLRVHDKLYTIPLNDKTKISRKDILVFHSHENILYVKRVIGLPGEVVDIRKGVVYIDGQKLDEPYIGTFDSETEGTFVVPEDSYLFLGDNRKYSSDARFWKNPYIQRDRIVSKVVFRYFPSNRIGFIGK